MSKIIKKTAEDSSWSTSLPSSGVVRKKTLDAQSEAGEIVSEAQQEARSLLAAAEAKVKEAQEIYEHERKRGYAEGESKALAQVTEQLLAIKKLKEDFFAQAEPELIRLSLAIAEKVLGRMVHEHPEAVQQVVRQALERSLGDRVVVKVSPQDYKALQEQQAEFKDVLDRSKRLLLKEDESIAQGGCVVETEVGTIDAQLETQLEAIRKAFGMGS